MARYDKPLFTLDDLADDTPYVEIWGHRIDMRDPNSFSLADNNKLVSLNNKLSTLEKMGNMSDPKVQELEAVCDDFLEFVCNNIPDEVREDHRWAFMVKLRVIRAFNQIFTRAMSFADEAETSPEDLDDR